MKATYINTPTSITANRRTVGTTAEVLNGSAKLGISADIYKQAVAPGYATAAKRNRSQRGCPATNRLSCVERSCKNTQELGNNQLELFDAAGNPSSDNSEMTVFFDTVRPHLQGLAPRDRMSILSGLYWLKAGESKESITGLLRKPLRAVFGDIVSKIQI